MNDDDDEKKGACATQHTHTHTHTLRERFSKKRVLGKVGGGGFCVKERL